MKAAPEAVIPVHPTGSLQALLSNTFPNVPGITSDGALLGAQMDKKASHYAYRVRTLMKVK